MFFVFLSERLRIELLFLFVGSVAAVKQSRRIHPRLFTVGNCTDISCGKRKCKK